jgi:glutamate/tyrosine decarboxylase-like PLP-dependent enzyme
MTFPAQPRDWFDVHDDLSRLERKSRFPDFEKNLFDEGPHLTSSPALPWGDEVRHRIVEGYLRFIHGETWHMGGGARDMEREVIAGMGALLGSDEAAGFITSGGSESNLCALLAAKSRAGRSGSVVMPRYAHYSFYKGCRMFDLEPIPVDPPEGKYGTVEPSQIEAAVRDDTICMIGTAGTWPFGTVDPIPELAAIAARREIYFHVDACFGGFILPFLERASYHDDLPSWDFRVPGVCSVSADLHKNGMVPPPASSLYFRDAALLEHAKQIAPPNGTLSGTRPTGPIASAWTAVQLMGVERYMAASVRSMQLKEQLIAGMLEIPGIAVVPGSKINIFVAYSPELDLAPVAADMTERGWMFVTNAQPGPLAICLCTMPQNERSAEPFLADLREAMSLATPAAPAGPESERPAYGNV